MLFYYDKPIPIIHSQSRDLAYGQMTRINPNSFVEEETFKKPCVVIVLDRDLQDFHKEMDDLSVPSHTLSYKLYKTNIFEVN